MKSFAYSNPNTIEDALALLGDQWGETEILAGGTDLVTCMKQGIVQPKRVVSLKNISALKLIGEENQKLKIGGMVTLDTLRRHPLVVRHFPALVQAIEGIGGQQMINQGTVGGDLCQRPRCWYFRNGYGLLARAGNRALVPEGDNRFHAVFGNEGAAQFVNPSSLAPALVALGAEVELAGPNNRRREIPVAELFRVPRTESERETTLMPSEVLTSVTIPLNGLRNATYEIRHRQGLDWPYATASVAFDLNAGMTSNVRIVLGQVAPVPWRTARAELVLNQATMTVGKAKECGEAATQGARPLSHNAYKLQLVKTAVQRAVLGAAGMQREV